MLADQSTKFVIKSSHHLQVFCKRKFFHIRYTCLCKEITILYFFFSFENQKIRCDTQFILTRFNMRASKKLLANQIAQNLNFSTHNLIDLWNNKNRNQQNNNSTAAATSVNNSSNHTAGTANISSSSNSDDDNGSSSNNTNVNPTTTTTMMMMMMMTTTLRLKYLLIISFDDPSISRSDVVQMKYAVRNENNNQTEQNLVRYSNRNNFKQCVFLFDHRTLSEHQNRCVASMSGTHGEKRDFSLFILLFRPK